LASHAAFCIWLLIQPSLFFQKKALCSGTAFWHFFIMLLAAADRKPETPCQKGQKENQKHSEPKVDSRIPSSSEQNSHDPPIAAYNVTKQ
jgi:hypothetical protein